MFVMGLNELNGFTGRIVFLRNISKKKQQQVNQIQTQAVSANLLIFLADTWLDQSVGNLLKMWF